MTTNFATLLDSCDFLLNWQKEKLRLRLNGEGAAGNGSPPDGEGDSEKDDQATIPVYSLVDLVDIITTAVDDVHRRVLGAGLDTLTPLEKLEIGWAARDSVLSNRACWDYLSIGER